MARPQVYQDSVQIGGAPQQYRGRASQLIDNTAANLKVASDGIGQVVKMGFEELDDDARAWAVNASSQADVAAHDIFETRKNSAADGAAGFKDGILDDWKKYQDKTMENAPNDRARQFMQSHFASTSESLTNKASDFQTAEMSRWRAKQGDDGVDADARLISTQGMADIDGTVEKSVGKWATYYGTMAVDPETRQKMLDGTREKLTNAANMRKIQLDPTAYLAQNASGRNRDILANDPSAPRGIRNNNPGNLRTDQFAGTVGVDKDGYGKFESPEQGLRAMAKNLLVQQSRHGLNTVQDIVAKYAPPTENDTGSYIMSVAGAMGVKPDQALNLKDPAIMTSMMQAMIAHENGTQPYSPKQIQAGIDSALNGTALPQAANGKTPDAGGRVATGNSAYNLGTWEQQQKWINLAETEQRRVQSERKQKVTETNVLLSSVKERMQSGLALPDDEMTSITASVAETGDPVTAKKWQDLQATQNLTQSMQQLSPAQLSTVINTQLEPAAHRDGATEREAMQLDIAQKLLGTMSTKVKDDPLSWAAQTGVPVTPLDFNDPASLPKRVATAEAIASKYGVPVEKSIFSQAEKTQFATSLESMPAQLKVDLGKRMQTGFGQYFTKAVGEISDKDPIFSQAAFLSSLSPGNDKLSLDILRGQEILKATPKLKPGDKDKLASLAAVGSAFEYMPRALAGITESADALYAQRVGLVDSFDQNAYEQALGDVMGKTKDGKGGIGDLNGKAYLLPQQYDENDFERGIAAMTPDELAAMSIGGGPPVYGKKKTPASGADMMTNVTFRSVAYGQYLAIDEDGNPVTSEKGPGGNFILAIDPAKFSQYVNRANERAAKRTQDAALAPGGM